jgi:peptidoglycan/LPS O-acetylase OafA/YrhL
MNRLGYLDGLRGVAALWVVLHHITMLAAGPAQLRYHGRVAVELFMILSGMLMYYHFGRVPPGGAVGHWKGFFVRRFFRIAPLYYASLVLVYAIAPQMGRWREAMAGFNPEAATEPTRFFIPDLAANALAHATFLFGFLPRYAYSTPLPDWSIGLEMQFYGFFPLILLVLSGIGLLRGTLLLTALAMVVNRTAFAQSFPLPTFLPLALHSFLTGILLGHLILHWDRTSPARIALLLAVGLALSGLSGVRWKYVLAVTAGVAFVAFHARLRPGVVRTVGTWCDRILSSEPMRFLGDASYGVYLTHVLVLTPLITGLFSIGWIDRSRPWPTFLIVSGLSLPVIYLLGWGLYRTIETWGIQRGKAVLKSWKEPASRPAATASSAGS